MEFVISNFIRIKKVAHVRYHNACFSLNRFHHVRANRRVLTELLFQSDEIVVWHFVETWHVRPEIGITVGIRGGGQRGDRTSTEVTFREDHGSLVFRNLLNPVTPTSSNFDRRVPGFDACNKIIDLFA